MARLRSNQNRLDEFQACGVDRASQGISSHGCTTAVGIGDNVLQNSSSRSYLACVRSIS